MMKSDRACSQRAINLQPSHTRCHSTGTSHFKEVLGMAAVARQPSGVRRCLGALALGQERVSVSDCSRRRQA